MNITDALKERSFYGVVGVEARLEWFEEIIGGKKWRK